MKAHINSSRSLTSSIALAAALLGASAWSQTPETQEPVQLAAADPEPVPDQSAVRREVIVVTGTRGEGRTALDSAVPIDVFTAEAIEDVSFSDTQDVLKTLVPSYTVSREPISDGATFIRPASLRGLSSDKTLVLVNSKRRHRAALVSIGGSGTQGPDVATIPASAIKSVEVLRDGAAAQYGSDAIAGVINFILKDSPEGGEVTFQAGQYYEEDGEDLLIAGNLGIPLGSSGFINVSVEGTTAQPTHRGKEWRTQASDPGNFGGQSSFDVFDYVAANPEVAYLFGNGEDFDHSNVQLWGQPEAEAFRTFINAGYTLSDSAELYAFANYSNSSSDGDFNYRFPTNSVNGPFIRRPDGTLFRFADRYPAGFNPRFGGNVVDYSATGGVRGQFTDGFSYDFSSRYGKNTIYYTLWNTVNPSLGEASPDYFQPGDLVSDEIGVNADFAYELDTGVFASPLNIGFGAEYRDEGYESVPGDEASYIAGPYAQEDPYGFCTDETNIALRTPTAAGAGIAGLNCASAADPVYQVMAVGSNGFPGYTPAYSGSLNRDSYGLYVDLEADVSSSLFLNVAGRFEDYSDFGTTTDGKIAARWTLTPGLNLRGSVSSGFRAPTPGQLATTNVSTRFAGGGEPIASGLFPASNSVSVFLGAQELEPEKSTNYSLGASADFGGLGLTVDLYKIEIADQFYAVSPITVTDAIRGELLAANVPGADTIGQVQFFQNAFDSETTGVDVVATYTLDWGGGGVTDLTASANYNKFEVVSVNIQNTNGTPNDPTDDFDLFDNESVYDFENGQPQYRATFSANHRIGDWGFMARANYYGSWSVSNNTPTGFEIQELGEEILVDIEISYDVTADTSIALGVRNVFDEYPDPGEYRLRETSNGRIYRSDSVVDWQGGFAYLKATHSF